MKTKLTQPIKKLEFADLKKGSRFKVQYDIEAFPEPLIFRVKEELIEGPDQEGNDKPCFKCFANTPFGKAMMYLNEKQFNELTILA